MAMGGGAGGGGSGSGGGGGGDCSGGGVVRCEDEPLPLDNEAALGEARRARMVDSRTVVGGNSRLRLDRQGRRGGEQ